MLDAFIYDGLRTPFGRHAGALAPVRPDDLAAGVMRALLARSPWKAEEFEDVYLGCTNQAGEDSRNVARHAALLAGMPATTPAQTLNRLCASGLAAVVEAARAITVGDGDLYLAGGVESMSRAPFAMAKAEAPYSREARVFDTTLGARFPNPRLVKLVRVGQHARDRRQRGPGAGHLARRGRPLRAALPGAVRAGPGDGIPGRGDRAGGGPRAREGDHGGPGGRAPAARDDARGAGAP